jgi:hypothetical protein
LQTSEQRSPRSWENSTTICLCQLLWCKFDRSKLRCSECVNNSLLMLGHVESLSVFGGSLGSVEYTHPNTARLQELPYV